MCVGVLLRTVRKIERCLRNNVFISCSACLYTQRAFFFLRGDCGYKSKLDRAFFSGALCMECVGGGSRVRGAAMVSSEPVSCDLTDNCSRPSGGGPDASHGRWKSSLIGGINSCFSHVRVIFVCVCVGGGGRCHKPM